MKVFLSSTYSDLVVHREAAARAIERLGQQGVRMEVFGARPLEPSSASVEEIGNADALVGIYAHRYGHVPPGRSISITEEEFVYAHEHNKPMFCFVVDGEYPWSPRHIDDQPGRDRLREFKKRLQSIVVTDTFSSPEDLAFKVSSSLGRFLLYQKVKQELEKVPGAAVSNEVSRSQVARRAARIQTVIVGAAVLLVNDFPSEISHVIEVLSDLGLKVQVVRSTSEAIAVLSRQRFHAVISDMARDGIEDEGLRLLKRMREMQIDVPIVFTVGRFDPARGTPPFAFGITNRVDECLNLLFDVLERVRG